MKLAIELDLPDGAVDNDGRAELVKSLREQAVLRLYAAGHISLGEAAQTLGDTRVGFMHLLTTSGVGYHVDLDADDFSELRSLRERVEAGGK